MSHPMVVASNRHVLILGHGISGRAMARWCVRLGAHVTIADTRLMPTLQHSALLAELNSLSIRPEQTHQVIHVPCLDASLVNRHDWALIGKSPGLSPKQLSDLNHAARIKTPDHPIPILGELAFFVDGLKKNYQSVHCQPKVLAITGTNGKTTTTALTSQLLERAGWRVAVAGNIGPALLDVLTAASPSDLPEVWVLELSSFQLDGIPMGPHGFEPDVAVILNITQDHLDWHGSMAAYAHAKYRVFGEKGIRVLNREDELVMQAHTSVAPMVTFGTDVPSGIGDWGLETVNGMTWLVQRQADGALLRLMPADALRIRGRHNAANALAALALTTAIGTPLAPLLHGLRDYRGEPHRVQSVAVVDGVEFFDDSKGTNVGATLAAIKGLGVDRKLIVILGGDGKGQDFSPLISVVQQHVKAVVLLGRDAPVLRETLASAVSSVPICEANDMGHAVWLAAKQAQSGDAVLLSPACASLDMFRNYAHRAEVFCQAVQQWGAEHGWVGEN